MGEPIRVVITGAAGQIAYSLLYSVAKGDVFGADQNIILVLLDLEFMKEVMNGVVMELNDCAFPLVQKIVATADYEEAFTGADACMLVGAMPRKQGMERKDLLAANVKIFKGQGMSIDKYAKKTVKIVVVGNPANTNALICSKYAPSIPKENFSALTRLDQNRAKSQIGNRLGINSSAVSNVIIWGNHSSTQYPDVEHAKVIVGSESASVGEKVQDDAWLKNDFVSTVQKRGAAVIAARKLSSAMSAAKATADHMKDWWCGTKGDEWTSMAVISDGNSYGIPAGLMYSFPVRIANHKWTIVDGLKISDFSRNKMDLTAKELTEERDAALEEVGKE